MDNSQRIHFAHCPISHTFFCCQIPYMVEVSFQRLLGNQSRNASENPSQTLLAFLRLAQAQIKEKSLTEPCDVAPAAPFTSCISNRCTHPMLQVPCSLFTRHVCLEVSVFYIDLLACVNAPVCNGRYDKTSISLLIFVPRDVTRIPRHKGNVALPIQVYGLNGVSMRLAVISATDSNICRQDGRQPL